MAVVDQRHAYRRAGVYSSRTCRHCDRLYLYPAYGGWAVCNDCVWTREDRPRKVNMNIDESDDSTEPRDDPPRDVAFSIAPEYSTEDMVRIQADWWSNCFPQWKGRT